jgi:hypothetical protein
MHPLPHRLGFQCRFLSTDASYQPKAKLFPLLAFAAASQRQNTKTQIKKPLKENSLHLDFQPEVEGI